MVHPTPTKVLLTTTLRPLVVQLSGSLARGVRLLDQFLHDEPTPQQMAKFEWELRTLLREVGRRIMAWVLNHVEPENHAEAPSRLWWKGEVYRRRRRHRTAMATLFGPVVVWRRLYEPLPPGRRAIHPLELTLGIEAGVATPALAERVGRWATDHRLSDSIRVIFYARHYGERYQKVTSSADDGSYPSSSRKIVLHQVLSHDGMQHYSAELAIVAACNVFTFNATSEPNATL